MNRFKNHVNGFKNFFFPNYKYLLFITDFDKNISLYSLYIFHLKNY